MLITFDFNPPTHSRALSPRLRSSGWISHMNLVYSLQCSCPSLRNIIWFSLPSRKEKFKFPSLMQSVACTSGLSQNVSPGNISLPRQGEQEGITYFNKSQGKNEGHRLWAQGFLPQGPAKQPSWPKSVTRWRVVETGRSLGKLPRLMCPGRERPLGLIADDMEQERRHNNMANVDTGRLLKQVWWCHLNSCSQTDRSSLLAPK